MIALLHALLHFALHFGDPSWACDLVHRDPGVAGTYVLYCEQTVEDTVSVSIVEVGKFIHDVRKEIP